MDKEGATLREGSLEEEDNRFQVPQLDKDRAITSEKIALDRLSYRNQLYQYRIMFNTFVKFIVSIPTASRIKSFSSSQTLKLKRLVRHWPLYRGIVYTFILILQNLLFYHLKRPFSTFSAKYTIYGYHGLGIQGRPVGRHGRG